MKKVKPPFGTWLNLQRLRTLPCMVLFLLCSCTVLPPAAELQDGPGTFTLSDQVLDAPSGNDEPDLSRSNRQVIELAGFASGVQPISSNSPPRTAGASRSDAVTFTAAQARQELGDSRERPADEYLFDGGDRGLPMHYNGHARGGLETEDTIVEFVDHRGESHVQASNRVAIYSPRFGAVRVVSGLHEETSVDRLASATELQRGSGLTNKVGSVGHAVNLRASDMRVRTRASGLENNEGQLAFHQRETAGEQIQNQAAILNLAFVKQGFFDQRSEPVLVKSIRAAATWTKDRYPMVTGSLQTGQEVYATFSMQEIVGIEEDHKSDGDLRIVKLADRQTAHPGDIITFTIRFDNLGDRELRDIRIVDHLTSRLEFMADSVQWDSDSGVTLPPRDDGEGSVVLEFRLADPLEGHRGGHLTFQCRVR